MVLFKEISLSHTEPSKSFMWLKIMKNGSIIPYIWSAGWKRIGSESASYDFTLNEGQGISIARGDNTFTIAIDSSTLEKISLLQDGLKSLEAKVDKLEEQTSFEIVTKEEIDNLCK